MVKTVLTKVTTVLTKEKTVLLTKVNTVLTKVNTVLTKVNTVLTTQRYTHGNPSLKQKRKISIIFHTKLSNLEQKN